MNARFVPAILAGLAVLCLVAIGVINQAAAQETIPRCSPRDELVKRLKEKWNEIPIAIGMVNEGLVMEAFGSPSGTWTLFMTDKDKMSCLMLDGTDLTFDTRAFDAAKKGEAF